MLDKLISGYSSRKHRHDDTGYTSASAIIDLKLANPKGEILTILFPPWHGAGKPFKILEHRLAQGGSATLSVNLHNQILSADINEVVQSFYSIQAQIITEIDKLQKKYKYREVHMIGLSIGTLSMSLVARAYPKVSQVTFVVGASRLAPCVWYGIRTQKIRKQVEANGFSLAKLELEWSDLAPALSAPILRGKLVQIYVSNSDKIIPTAYQTELVHTMLDAGANVRVFRSNYGHTASIIKFCLSDKLVKI